MNNPDPKTTPPSDTTLHYTQLAVPRTGAAVSAFALLFAALPYILAGALFVVPRTSATAWLPFLAALSCTVGVLASFIMALISIVTATPGPLRAMGWCALFLLVGGFVIALATGALPYLLMTMLFWGWSGPG